MKMLPLLPLPSFEKCLGLEFEKVKIKIEDGYMSMSNNFGVTPAKLKCLFHHSEVEGMEEKKVKKQKKARMTEAEAKQANKKAANNLKKLGGKLDKAGLKDMAVDKVKQDLLGGLF